jgi:hypothetical protein
MIESITLAQTVDVLFFTMLTLAVAKLLYRPAQRAEATALSNSPELKNLELTLKDLLGEAAHASSSLDRSLTQRKRELEKLLEKLEGQEKIVEKKQAKTETSEEIASPAITLSTPVEEDLEKGSWMTIGEENEPAFPRSSASVELDSLVESQKDSVTITRRPRPVANNVPQPIISKVEKLVLEQKKTAAKVRELPDGLTGKGEPSAYRIAKRLLSEGKEIHVVARKLEIPLADVRLLDRLLREEKPKTQSEEFAEEAISRFAKQGRVNSLEKNANEREVESEATNIERTLEEELSLI